MPNPRELLPSQRNDQILERVASSRKYRNLGIPVETIRDLITRASKKTADPDRIEEIVREKMHNLVAPYLGDPDYLESSSTLEALNFSDSGEVKGYCTGLLNSHSSTRERLPLLDYFYTQLFALTGVPGSIQDLACGLNPFSLPWMNIPRMTIFRVFDLQKPRMKLIDQFIRKFGQAGTAETRDILIDPPLAEVDMTFFFKEAHRFDQRQRGCNREFFHSLKTKWLIVSLPTASLTGRRSMLEQDRRLIAESTSGMNWEINEILFENEILFCIQKAT